MAHWSFAHTASALGSDGSAQVSHAAPQRAMLSSGKHPLIIGQVWVPAPQVGPQTPPAVQADPAGQGVQSTPSIVPQVALATLLTHTPLHR
jgi:hypothetical protein